MSFKLNCFDKLLITDSAVMCIITYRASLAYKLYSMYTVAYKLKRSDVLDEKIMNVVTRIKSLSEILVTHQC